MLYTRPAELYRCGSLDECRPKLVVIPVYQEDEKPVLEGLAARVDEESGGQVSTAVGEGLFKAGRGETYTVAAGGRIYLLVGLGKKEGDTKDSARRAFAKAAKSLVDKYEEVVLVLEDLDKGVAEEALIGFLLGAYKLEAFKTEKKGKLARVYYLGEVDEKLVSAVVEGVYLARDVANAPPNDLYPERLAEKVKELFSGFDNVEVEVFDYKRLVEEGFGGIVSVGKGSAYKPALIIIRVRGGGDKKIALVGKTIVFDAGGMQIKPSYSMMSMYADKAGGAAVLGTAWALAKLGLPVDFYGLLGAAINVPSGESYLPSDVIRMWDGTTVDVGHTDAEGRLVIADAIAYAAKQLDAEIIIDMATLTGAAVVALGPLIAALFTRDDELARIIEEASKETGDLVWRMPMADVYKPLLTKHARLADINNVAGRWAGAIYGALFLERFSHGKRFVHLDIAGPGIGGSEAASVAPEYWPGRKAPGYGVRLAVETLRRLASREG